MVLTPGYIKVITKAIASQIITELKKPLKKSFNTIEPAGVCKVVAAAKTLLLTTSKIMNAALIRRRKAGER